ncbi:hypothetical protein C0992_013321 [Termitomyces sp. T32_za158]|nr:hypothetical protein C0992_013321 [Termitomyces sp. T32_za158]
MKQNFYKITSSNRFQAVIQFLRKELAWQPGDPLVSPHHTCSHPPHPAVYIRQPRFLPRTRRHRLQSLQGAHLLLPAPPFSSHTQSFATDGHLIVNYRSAAVPPSLPSSLSTAPPPPGMDLLHTARTVSE